MYLAFPSQPVPALPTFKTVGHRANSSSQRDGLAELPADESGAGASTSATPARCRGAYRCSEIVCPPRPGFHKLDRQRGTMRACRCWHKPWRRLSPAGQHQQCGSRSLHVLVVLVECDDPLVQERWVRLNRLRWHRCFSDKRWDLLPEKTNINCSIN